MAVGSHGPQNRVVGQSGRIELRRSKIGGLQIRKLGENIGIRHAGAEHLQKILHPNAHAENTRFPSTRLGIDGDSLAEVHEQALFTGLPFSKLSLKLSS